MPAVAIQSLLTVAQTPPPLPPPWNIVAHHAYMFHPHPGGLEWHRDHDITQPSWLRCSKSIWLQEDYEGSER